MAGDGGFKGVACFGVVRFSDDEDISFGNGPVEAVERREERLGHVRFAV